MMTSDIMVFTETQMLPQTPDNDTRQYLHPFDLIRQDHPTDKYMSLALCTKKPIQVTSYDYFPSINGIKFEIESNIKMQKQSFLLVYRKQSTSIRNYITGLKNILSVHDIDTVLGDFNINYFNDKDSFPLKSMMESLEYKQIVQQPTFISSGSLIDHVYIKESSKLKILKNEVTSVYYSDHDAINLYISKSVP